MDTKLKDFVEKASKIKNAKLYVENYVEFNHNGDNSKKDIVAVAFNIKNTDSGNIEAEYIVYAKNMDENMDELINKVNQLQKDYFSEYETEEDF